MRQAGVLPLVIPGRAQRVRPTWAGPMTGSGAIPESMTTVGGYGFRHSRFALSRNDGLRLLP